MHILKSLQLVQKRLVIVNDDGPQTKHTFMFRIQFKNVYLHNNEIILTIVITKIMVKTVTIAFIPFVHINILVEIREINNKMIQSIKT